MFEVHPLDLEGTAVFGCAQAECRACQEALLLRHEGLVHFFLQRQARDGVAYDDLAQEDRRGVLLSGMRCWALILGEAWPSRPTLGWPSSAGSGKQWPGPGGIDGGCHPLNRLTRWRPWKKPGSRPKSGAHCLRQPLAYRIACGKSSSPAMG